MVAPDELRGWHAHSLRGSERERVTCGVALGELLPVIRGDTCLALLTKIVGTVLHAC
jgi:hypothetical protein